MGLIAGTIEIGENLNGLGIAVIVALPTIILAVQGKRAKDAALEAKDTAHDNKRAVAEVAAQLRPNGGSTAFDKITKIQRDTQLMVARLDGSVTDLAGSVVELTTKVDKNTERINALEPEDTPQ